MRAANNLNLIQYLHPNLLHSNLVHPNLLHQYSELTAHMPGTMGNLDAYSKLSNSETPKSTASPPPSTQTTGTNNEVPSSRIRSENRIASAST